MPKREKADHALICATYDRLQNTAATAREMGLHYNTVYDALRRRANQCIDCHSPIKNGRRVCPPCAKRQADRAREKRAQKRRDAVCYECANPIAWPSKQYCEDHRIQFLERNDRYKNEVRKRRGSVSKETNFDAAAYRHRLRVKDAYGDAGVAVWDASGMRCALCDAAYLDTMLHIHHINCDEKDHRVDNLICLCFNCHRMVHHMLRCTGLPKALAWFADAYPDKKTAP